MMPPAAAIRRLLREVSVDVIAWVNDRLHPWRSGGIAGLCSAMPRILVAKEIFHIQGAALAFVQ